VVAPFLLVSLWEPAERDCSMSSLEESLEGCIIGGKERVFTETPFPNAKSEGGSPVNGIVNSLIKDDCIAAMRQLPNECVDMVLCDLPYGTTQNKWDSVIPLDELWKQYRRVVRNDGAIVLTSQGPFTARLIMSNEKLFKYKIVWVKSKPTNFLNAKKQPLRKHEDVCVFYRRQPVYNPQMSPGEPYTKGTRKDQFSGSYGDFKPVLVQSGNGDRYPVDVVYFKTAESEGPVWHPTQKPVELGRWMVRTFTAPGDIVMDNAFGSGSFLVSAILEGRNFIGIEKNDSPELFKAERIDLVNIAKERLKKAYESVRCTPPGESLLMEGLLKEFESDLCPVQSAQLLEKANPAKTVSSEPVEERGCSNASL